MIENEVMKVILARRSCRSFDGRPIGDEELDTILTAGKYAPTGMNRQPWHFTVIKSREMLDKVAAAAKNSPRPAPPAGVAPAGMPAGGPHPAMSDPADTAAALILVSGDSSVFTSHEDCVLAMENMFLAATSLGIYGGWQHAYGANLFSSPANDELKKQLIPEGYTVYASAFFGYPSGEFRDRGERKEGTVSIF